MSGMNLGYQERGPPLNGGFNRPNFRFTSRPLGRGGKRETNRLIAHKSLGDTEPESQSHRGGWTIRSRFLRRSPGAEDRSDFQRLDLLCGENEPFATADDSTGAIGRLRRCSRLRSAIPASTPSFVGSANSKRSSRVKTRVDFRMNVSPQLCEPTQS
jgi:hypothetical protein